MQKNKLILITAFAFLIILITTLGIIFLLNNYFNHFEEETNNDKVYGEQIEYYTNDPNQVIENNEIIKEVIFICEEGKVIEIVEGEYTIEVTVIREENDLCEVFAKLTRAPGFEALLIGSNATCFLTQSEINQLSNDTDISKLNCSGVLYELAKAR